MADPSSKQQIKGPENERLHRPRARPRGAATTEARVANFASLSGRSNPNWCRDDGGGAVSSGADVDDWTTSRA